MAGRGAAGAGDVALVDDTRLLGDAAKPWAAVADDGGSGRDPGAQAFGFAGAESAHDLEAGVQRSTVIGRLDCGDEGRVSTSAAPGPFAGAFAADVSVVDLDARAGGAELVTTVALRGARAAHDRRMTCVFGSSCPGPGGMTCFVRRTGHDCR